MYARTLKSLVYGHASPPPSGHPSYTTEVAARSAGFKMRGKLRAVSTEASPGETGDAGVVLHASSPHFGGRTVLLLPRPAVQTVPRRGWGGVIGDTLKQP